MVFIFVEDELSEAVISRIISYIESSEGKDFGYRYTFNKRGCGNIKREMRKYNDIAGTYPVIVLVDLDTTDCAPLLIDEFVDFSPNRKLVFRVAVREVEAWLLADRRNLADFLGVGINKIPARSEEVADPKDKLISIARRSRKREIKEDIPPETASMAEIGKNYNGRLKEFVIREWDIDGARQTLSGKSLDKAIDAIGAIEIA